MGTVSMRKPLAGLIAALFAMLMALAIAPNAAFADLVVGKQAVDSDVVFTVYAWGPGGSVDSADGGIGKNGKPVTNYSIGASQLKVVKTYTAADLEKLAAKNTTAIASVMNDSVVIASKKYVIFSELLSDAEISMNGKETISFVDGTSYADFKAGSAVKLYGKWLNMSYDDYSASRYWYPGFSADNAKNAGGATESPMALALSYGDEDISTTASTALSSLNYAENSTLRMIMGQTEAGKTLEGWHFVTGPNGIVLNASSLNNATISGLADKAYTGKQIKQTPKVSFFGTELKEGVDYTVSYGKNKTVKDGGTVTITSKGEYSDSVTVPFKITKAKAKCPSKTKISKSISKAKLKKKAQKFTAIKLTTDGKAAYTVTKKNSNLSIKNGVVTVKKGTKKGTYTMKVKVSAKAGSNYEKLKAKTYTIKVTVK